MKKDFAKTKLLPILLVLCMVLPLVPLAVLAAEASAETADFTVDGGAAAIRLLNAFKTAGAADSVWENGSRTLTLRGIDFVTTAQTAVKLPAGATVILADGSTNTIQSGDASIHVSGKDQKHTFLNAVEAVGDLTIAGEAKGTGTLCILAGDINNSENGWTYSSGVSIYGDFTVKGGHVTAQGGCVQVVGDGGCAFSLGVNMENNIKNKALSVSGGSLTAIAGEAYTKSDAGSAESHPEFSRGVYLYRGNAVVSGNGVLTAQSVPAMADASLLSNGIYLSVGDLIVADTADVTVSGAYGAYISGGGILLSGGKLTAESTLAPDSYGNLSNALDVGVSSGIVTANAGNITVSGGTLETVNGKIYMSTFGAKENQGLFTVTGGSIVNSGRLYGPKKLDISGGTVQTGQIDADALTLSDGSLTIREPVRKSSYNDELYALPALDVSTLTVSGGTLDAAWDWGEYTPMVLPKDEEYNDVGILVRMPYDFNTATFTAGTTMLNTGKAGNTALLIGGKLTLGEGMEETGADTEHRQRGSAPARFAAAVRCDGGANCPGSRFTDMPAASNWAHAGIDYAVENGLFSGMSETTFEPNTAMTRAMLVRVLWLMTGSPAHNGENPFSDVESSHWFYDGVVWAAENGIVAGMGEGKFAPNEKITREQIAAILYRYSEKAGMDVDKKADLAVFPDAAAISGWAGEALAWANANGYISGVAEGGTVYLRPKNDATRAQVASILMRYCKDR